MHHPQQKQPQKEIGKHKAIAAKGSPSTSLLLSLKNIDKQRILIGISLLCSAPATAAILSIIMALYSPIGLGILNKLQAAALGVLFLSIVPTVAAFVFYKKGIVDIEVSERKKRTPIYFISLGSQALATLVFNILSTKIMFVLSAAYVAVTLFILFINMKWKISAHAAGIAGPITSLCIVFGWSLLPLYLLLIPIFMLRLILKAHDIWQLIGGTAVSIIVTYFVYLTLL